MNHAISTSIAHGHYEDCVSDAFLAECLQEAFDNDYVIV